MFDRAFVAQRIEHLTTDQKVGGSNPSERTSESLVRVIWRGFFVYVFVSRAAFVSVVCTDADQKA